MGVELDLAKLDIRKLVGNGNLPIVFLRCGSITDPSNVTKDILKIKIK